MTETRPSTPSPFRAPWLVATVVVILGTLFMLGLGIWQLDRLQQRRAANAQIMARMSQPALKLTGGALDPEANDLRRATVRGVFDYDQEVILRNRTYGEVPGVHQLVPLRIAGSDAAVLVDRGWIPFEFSSPEQRAQFRNATGEVEVQGILRHSQTRRNNLSPADPPLGPERARLEAWFRVDLPRIQEQMPYRLSAAVSGGRNAARRRSALAAAPRSRHPVGRRLALHLCHAVVRFRRDSSSRVRISVPQPHQASSQVRRLRSFCNQFAQAKRG